MNLHEVNKEVHCNKSRKRLGTSAPARALARRPARATRGSDLARATRPCRFFEGGQMPLVRRIPKRAIPQPFRTKDVAIVNVGDLEMRL